MAKSLQDTSAVKTLRDSKQSVLAPILRRRVVAALEKHLSLHVPTLSPRRISLVDGRAANTTKGAGLAFIVKANFPVYGFTLIQLARYGIAPLAPSGSALLVLPPHGPAMLVEVNDSQDPVRVTSGPTVDNLYKALNRETQSAQTGTSTASLFRVAALHLHALWRVGARAEMSAFIPYGANHAGAKPGRMYRFAHFQKILQDKATQEILRWYERYEQERFTKLSPAKTGTIASSLDSS